MEVHGVLLDAGSQAQQAQSERVAFDLHVRVVAVSVRVEEEAAPPQKPCDPLIVETDGDQRIDVFDPVWVHLGLMDGSGSVRGLDADVWLGSGDAS